MSGYDRRLVEHLLPAVWDVEAAYGIRNPTAPDADMPKGSTNPKEGSILQAHLADIRRAWEKAPLPYVLRQALFMRFALDYIHEEIAIVQNVTRQAVGYRLDRGVGELTAWLNGVTYVDGYDGEEDAEAA
ncbi:hypothetical protein [Actinocorallia libanotica]|uniref:Uncharacterized protein n=1 Tax=Actinocorallia libanotica TaxID=46162 RepID=A0ABN1RXM5_9ACTN